MIGYVWLGQHIGMQHGYRVHLRKKEIGLDDRAIGDAPGFSFLKAFGATFSSYLHRYKFLSN